MPQKIIGRNYKNAHFRFHRRGGISETNKNSLTQQSPSRLNSAHGILALRDATSRGKQWWRGWRRRQLTRGLTCQSCPVNLSHSRWLLRLLLNSPCDMLLAARTAWQTPVVAPGTGRRLGGQLGHGSGRLGRTWRRGVRGVGGGEGWGWSEWAKAGGGRSKVGVAEIWLLYPN